MLLHKRHALRKAFAEMADVAPEETPEQLGSKAEYEARKQMSFQAFSELLHRFRPQASGKVRFCGHGLCYMRKGPHFERSTA
jgi:hypothetical protein